jgi:RNA polymerase sigma-70 factor (ECF subfamily)
LPITNTHDHTPSLARPPASRRGPAANHQAPRPSARSSPRRTPHTRAPGTVPAPRTLDGARAGDHLDRLYRVARAITGSAQDAEDLVQDTYARVLARPRTVRADDDFGYLVAALRHTYIDGHRRRRLHTVPLEELTVEPVSRGSRAQPEQEVMAREIYRAIADLPDAYCDAIAAVDLGGLSYVEAAQALGVPLGTVMSRLYRARAQLATRFA